MLRWVFPEALEGHRKVLTVLNAKQKSPVCPRQLQGFRQQAIMEVELVELAVHAKNSSAQVLVVRKPDRAVLDPNRWGARLAEVQSSAGSSPQGVLTEPRDVLGKHLPPPVFEVPGRPVLGKRNTDLLEDQLRLPVVVHCLRELPLGMANLGERVEELEKDAHIAQALTELMSLLQELPRLLGVSPFQEPVNVALEGEGTHLEIERFDFVSDDLRLGSELERFVVELPHELQLRKVEVSGNFPLAVTQLPMHFRGQLEALLGVRPVTAQCFQIPFQQRAIRLLRLELELARQDGHLLRQALGLLDVAKLEENAPQLAKALGQAASVS